MRTLAVLPVKSFGRAKQRLGEAVGASSARALARGDGAGRARGAGGACAGSTASIVVSRELRDRGRRASCTIPTRRGSRRRPLRGVRAAVERGAERVLLVPGDCPALDPAEVDALLADGRAGRGDRARPPRLGHERAADRAADGDRRRPSARARSPATPRSRTPPGRGCASGALPSLELDVDTPGDLEALRAALRARAPAARRARARCSSGSPARTRPDAGASLALALAGPAGGPPRRRPRRACSPAAPLDPPLGPADVLVDRAQGRLEGRGPRARARRRRARRPRPRARGRARQGPAPRPGRSSTRPPSCCAPTAAA